MDGGPGTASITVRGSDGGLGENLQAGNAGTITASDTGGKVTVRGGDSTALGRGAPGNIGSIRAGSGPSTITVTGGDTTAGPRSGGDGNATASFPDEAVGTIAGGPSNDTIILNGGRPQSSLPLIGNSGNSGDVDGGGGTNTCTITPAKTFFSTVDNCTIT
ncbi:hypothetical protein FQU76_03065 [Streptomyces qinzhouensis]|uniref:Uncharacterized protein n=1 Tax=Streptomyces qinzhouensis TaxID=2599401 RepID=A0A5B8IQC0_9ACTN|nr:hypothetical protein FQU76_03065 [Streptomyces qinzhouensis]